MTTKDYIIISQAIKTVWNQTRLSSNDKAVVDLVIASLVSELGMDNLSFKSDLFISACKKETR